LSRKKLRVVVPVVVACLVGGAASAVAASRSHTAVPKAYKLAAALKGPGAGTFVGKLAVTGTKGSLAWSVALRPSGPAKSAQIRLGATGAGKLLVSLCAPCTAAAHGTKLVTGTALTSIAGNHSAVVVTTAKGTLRGPAKATPTAPPTGGTGGGFTVTPTPALIAQGKALVEQFSCVGCHTITGAKSTGPTWKGLAGSNVHTTGGVVTATDQYLLDAITDPATLKVVGYDPGVMAEVIAPGAVSDKQAAAIIAYIKTLK
jgi:cytochrome c2